MVLKYNGSILKVNHGASTIGYNAPAPPPDKLIIDLNGTGNERTADFLSQTRYPGVWEGFRIFETNDGVVSNTTYDNFVKNLQALDSNFTMYYWFAIHYNSTTYEWGQATYTADNASLVARSGGWTSAGQDSRQPWYDKSRYRTVEVNVSKGGDIDWKYWYNYDGWYGSRIYYAIPEQLITKVINPKS